MLTAGLVLGLLCAGHSAAGVLSETDFKQAESLKPLFANLMTDLVETAKRPDVPSGDAGCINSTIRELLQISDELASYEWRPVLGAPPANGLGAVVQVAMDHAGNLYLLWSEPDALRLIISRDGGHSWGTPLTVSAPGLHQITLAGLAAGARGAVGIVYYASTNPAAETLSGYISQTRGALALHPLFVAGAVNDPTQPIFKNYGDSYSPRADFVGGTFDRAGTFWGALVEQLGPPSEADTLTTTGYVGHLAG